MNCSLQYSFFFFLLQSRISEVLFIFDFRRRPGLFHAPRGPQLTILFQVYSLFLCVVTAARGITLFIYLHPLLQKKVRCNHSHLMSFDRHHASDTNKVPNQSLIATGTRAWTSPARPWSSHRSPLPPSPLPYPEVICCSLCWVFLFTSTLNSSGEIYWRLPVCEETWRNVVLWNMFFILT